jgi:hypothetical protein
MLLVKALGKSLLFVAEQQKVQEESDKQLVANGWQRKADRDSDIPDPWSRVEHKYFSVSHRSI